MAPHDRYISRENTTGGSPPVKFFSKFPRPQRVFRCRIGTTAGERIDSGLEKELGRGQLLGVPFENQVHRIILLDEPSAPFSLWQGSVRSSSAGPPRQSSA